LDAGGAQIHGPNSILGRQGHWFGSGGFSQGGAWNLKAQARLSFVPAAKPPPLLDGLLA
jgi:hypothetical protein